ncbi:MAG: hypothetical protein IJS82_03345 [Paludibacteraceae bacterium]|nr:hypothetical protein [Paludibacteraceae bacterium]
MKKFLLFVSAVLLVLTGCEQQSKLDVDQISGSAKVSGRVLYNPGYQAEANGTILAGFRPAANREIIVEVFYSGLASPGKLINAKTDEEGKYALDIPVGPTAVNISVTPVAFVDKYFENIGGTSLDIREVSASYSGAAVAGIIRDGDATILADITMAANTVSALESRTKQVVLSGQVLVNKQNPIYDYEGNVIGVNPVLATESAQTTVDITFVNQNDPTRRLVFNSQPLSDGVYEITAQLYDTWSLEDVYVQVVSAAYMTDKYIEYYQNEESKWVSRRVEGIYQSNNTGSYLNANVELTHKFEMPNNIIMSFVKTSTSN